MKNRQTWLITGASSGFGKALATYLAQQPNINLVATARNPHQLTYLGQYDQEHLIQMQLDVTNQMDINTVVQEALQHFNTIDVLVNNAGIGYFGTFEESNLETARKLYEVNFWGLVAMTRAILPTMRQQEHGTIINMSSVGGLIGFPTYSFYNSSKFAVEGISEALATEVADHGIHVMLVEPSGFRTEWGASADTAPSKITDYHKLHDQVLARKSQVHAEAGNPKQAAKIIYQMVTEHTSLPLHLLLGKMAGNTAIANYTNSLASFKTNYPLTISADYDDRGISHK